MKVQLKVLNLIAALLLIAATIFAMFSGVVVSYAATTHFSDVLDDLRKDSTFNVADYPTNNKNYSLQVIQIAESSDGELFIYVYQPAATTILLKATEINMSLSESADGTKLYGLTPISFAGVFGKYKVNGLTVKSDPVRYYNITSIYRPWQKGIDAETGNDNTVAAVSFEVGKLYTAKTENGDTIYSNPKQTVTVTDKYLDFLRYIEGFHLWTDACDSHYVAFSSNWDIDYLCEAELEYTFCKAKYILYHNGSEEYSYEEKETKTVSLSDIDTAHTTVTGLLGVKHSWSRIERVSDFLKNEELTSTAKNNVSNKQWVLRFAETAIMASAGSIFDNFKGKMYFTSVSAVTILRLKFEHEGTIYNLGVIDNKQSGDNIPGNPIDPKFNFFAWLANVLGVPEWAAYVIFFGVLALIVLAILLPILSAIFPVVGQVLKWIVKGIGFVIKWLFIGLWYLITWPFQLIALIVKKSKEDDGAENA